MTSDSLPPETDIFSLLKELSETPGVSGQEERIRACISDHLAPLVDELRTDTLGNLTGYKRGADSSAGRVMLAAHMDEIGLIVTRLEQGFLRFAPVGGVDLGALPAQEVTVHGRDDLPGLIASRPPHVLSPQEREKPFTQAELFIDTGLSAEALDEAVSVGDFISVAVVTVQEEIGLRGAKTATFEIVPDAGIALDVAYAEQPGATADEALPMGSGPAIGLGPNIHPVLKDLLVSTAERNEIPFTIEALPGNSGTDAWAMQVTQAGIRTALVSVPIRNMHTPAETVALKDIERSARLLTEAICDLPDDLSALALDNQG